MGRPPLPLGTYGKIKTEKETATRFRATCQFRDFDGEVRKVSRWDTTETRAANRLRADLRERQVQGAEISPESKFADLFAPYIAELLLLVDLGNRADTTIDTYENRWNKLLKPRVGGYRIREFTTGRADKILQEINKSHSASTAKNCRAVLSGMCGVAVRNDALKVNPIREARSIETGKRKAAPRALTLQETLHIFQLFDNDPVACRQDLPDIARFYGGTGNRTGEAMALRWENIDFAAKTVSVEGIAVRSRRKGSHVNDGKTINGERDLPLADWLVDMLSDRRKRLAALHSVAPESLTGWVFPSSTGTRRENNNLRRDWRAFRNRHDIGEWFTPRTFRRTVATVLTDKLPRREASDMLGHSQLAQTDVYIGRKTVSRRPAEVLAQFGGSKNGSKTESTDTQDATQAVDLR